MRKLLLTIFITSTIYSCNDSGMNASEAKADEQRRKADVDNYSKRQDSIRKETK